MTVCPSLSSAGSSDFLYIVFNTLWHVDVDDTFEMREVQTHSQSYRCHHYFDVSLPEFRQSFSLLTIAQCRVINRCLQRS